MIVSKFNFFSSHWQFLWTMIEHPLVSFSFSFCNFATCLARMTVYLYQTTSENVIPESFSNKKCMSTKITPSLLIRHFTVEVWIQSTWSGLNSGNNSSIAAHFICPSSSDICCLNTKSSVVCFLMFVASDSPSLLFFFLSSLLRPLTVV